MQFDQLKRCVFVALAGAAVALPSQGQAQLADGVFDLVVGRPFRGLQCPGGTPPVAGAIPPPPVLGPVDRRVFPVCEGQIDCEVGSNNSKYCFGVESWSLPRAKQWTIARLS
jgi:hypothetical protein